MQQLHDDMRKLLDGLEKMLPFIDFLKEHATNNLLTDTITALLNLIEDSSNFMIAYLVKNTAGMCRITEGLSQTEGFLPSTIAT